MADDAELVIAGAGLSGMLLGLACAGAGLQVAIVDPQDPVAMLHQGFDGRTSAIAYGSRLVFDDVAERNPLSEVGAVVVQEEGRFVVRHADLANRLCLARD